MITSAHDRQECLCYRRINAPSILRRMKPRTLGRLVMMLLIVVFLAIGYYRKHLAEQPATYGVPATTQP